MVMISETFGSILSDIKMQMKSNKHTNAVDLQLTFDSLEVKKGGIPIISKKTKKKELSIKLATRITPDEK